MQKSISLTLPLLLLLGNCDGNGGGTTSEEDDETLDDERTARFCFSVKYKLRLDKKPIDFVLRLVAEVFDKEWVDDGENA